MSRRAAVAFTNQVEGEEHRGVVTKEKGADFVW